MIAYCIFTIIVYREIYQAKRYHDEFATPMVCIDGLGRVFVNDFIVFTHNIGHVMGKIIKFFLKVSFYFVIIIIMCFRRMMMFMYR